MEVVVDNDRRNDDKAFGLFSISLVDSDDNFEIRCAFDLIEVSLKENLPFFCKAVRTEEKVMAGFGDPIKYFKFFIWFDPDANSKHVIQVFFLSSVDNMILYLNEN